LSYAQKVCYVYTHGFLHGAYNKDVCAEEFNYVSVFRSVECHKLFKSFLSVPALQMDIKEKMPNLSIRQHPFTVILREMTTGPEPRMTPNYLLLVDICNTFTEIWNRPGREVRHNQVGTVDP
jgi:hypothetical protein